MITDAPTVDDPARVIAHRGASRVAPENTLAAFQVAADLGARWVEFDVSLLGDGTPVIFHDATLDRCTNASGPLSGLRVADLARIDASAAHGAGYAGEPIPTLDEALDFLEDAGLFANLEMKTHDNPTGALTDAVAARLSARPWTSGRMVTSSFDLQELAAFRAALPEAPVAVLYEDAPSDWRARLTALRAEAMHLHFTHISQSLLAEAASFGFAVRVYTINDPALMEPFRPLGLGGVITDHPPLFLDEPAWAEWASH